MKIENPTAAKRTKLVYFTRDLSLATSNLSITSIGLKPSTLFVNAVVPLTVINNIGFYDVTKAGMSIRQHADGATDGGAPGMYFYVSAGNYQIVTLVSYDNDGFTLLWDKTGSPTGIVSVVVLAME